MITPIVKHFLICAILLLGLICTCAIEGKAQRANGELNIIIDGSSQQIDVTAQTTVHGTKDAWYPEVDSLQGKSGYGTELHCYHINRISEAEDDIGYAVYKISIGSYYIYVDWRDADYSFQPPYVDYDVWIHFDPSVNRFYRIPKSGSYVWFQDGATTGVWECGLKGSPSTPRIPVTVTNSFGHGQVFAEGTNNDVPFTNNWTVGVGDSIGALSPQTPGDGLTYQFSSWSDGGAQGHRVSAALSQFADVFTANFSVSAVSPVTNLQVGGDVGDNVHLSWTANPNSGVDYHVYRKVRHNGTMGSEVYLTTLAAGTESWDDPDWTVASYSSDQLYYDVRAHYNSTGIFASNQWVGGVWGAQKTVPGQDGGTATALQLPSRFALEAYPNPFNPTTFITVSLPEAAHVRVSVYDLLGRELNTLAAGSFEAGRYSLAWKASSAASGTYYARLTVTDAAGQVKFTSVTKLVLAK